MVKFNCIVLFFICPLIYFAQQVNNVEASQLGQNIVVTYDLETEQPCTINLFISTNGGNTWQGPLKQVQGQVGPNIKSGQNSITLFVLNEFNELRGDNIRFKVDASTTNLKTATNNLNTIKIGDKIWTTRNLDVTTYRNGDPIPEVQNAKAWKKLKTGAWCYFLNRTETGEYFGMLYNWYAVNDPRGLAPKGYHIPTDAEWTILTDYLDFSHKANYRESEDFSNIRFAGLEPGCRGKKGKFDIPGAFGNWWSSSEFDSRNARFCWNRRSNIFGTSNLRKHYGLSVRCIKD